jgi:predicted TIM-barrel fold metal-dependent hydrolase
MKIIDSRARLRTEQLLKAWTTELRPFFNDYIGFYKMKPRLTIMPVQELIDYAAQSGVERMVVCGGNRQDNDHILELSKDHAEIIPVGGVSVGEGIRFALRDIQEYTDKGVAAINMSPFMSKLDANDRSLYPIYGLCELLKKPIIVHGSLHYWRGAYMYNGQPQYIDEVAVDFPELKLIVSHGGNGFGPPILAVAQRHPNVYLEFSALNPAYMAPEFISAANTYLKDKCLFGTDYPLIEFDIAIERWKKVLRENVYDKFFYQNVLDALYKEPIPL